MSNQNRDQLGRYASGDGSGGKVTNTVRERNALRAMVDARKYLAARTSIRNVNPPALYPAPNPGTRAQRTDMPHHYGIDNATLGKALDKTGR